jgi:hypothetical protein
VALEQGRKKNRINCVAPVNEIYIAATFSAAFGRVNRLGLADLDRNLRPVGEAYRDLVSRWREILPTQSTVLDICPDTAAAQGARSERTAEAR